MVESIESMFVDCKTSLLENSDSSSFESLSAEILYELLEYFKFNEILHSFNKVCFRLDWLIFNDSRFYLRGIQLSSKSPHLYPGINETRIALLTLRHTTVSLSLFVNLRSLSIRTRCNCPEKLREMSQELVVLTRLISFKLNITGYCWDSIDDSEDPEGDSHGLISAAFAHLTLQRFILKAPYVSFTEYDNRLPSLVPVSTSLKYVEIPTFSTSFYFIDPLKLLPVVRHIHFGSKIPHRLRHPHTYLRSLILELYYWPLLAIHSFLVKLVALRKLTVYGFAGRQSEKLFAYTCLLPIFSRLQLADIDISIRVQLEDETIEQFRQELEQERVRNGWTELHITSIAGSCTSLKGLLRKK